MWRSGHVESVTSDGRNFVYHVIYPEMDCDTVDDILEQDLEQLVLTFPPTETFPQGWILVKDMDVFVLIGKTTHPAKINSLVLVSDEIDSNSIWIRWSNQLKETVELCDVLPMEMWNEKNKSRRKKN